MANMFKSVLASARAILQRKTVTPTTSVQTITPDSGYDGLEQVTVNAVNLQSKTTTMTPPSPSSWSATTTKLGTVTPDSGYTGLSQADISIPMIPDNTTLSLQSSGSDYDTYKPSRAGYVFTSSYLRVPKSGGGLSETTLWENPSPSSAFSGQTVSLSSSMTNYTYIKIYARRSNSDSTVLEAIYPVSFFITTSYSGTSKSCAALGWRTEASGVVSARVFGYSSNTSIQFGGAFNNNAETGTKSCIPIKITGLK